MEFDGKAARAILLNKLGKHATVLTDHQARKLWAIFKRVQIALVWSRKASGIFISLVFAVPCVTR